MATINTNKADKIMLYLRGNGYARGGAEQLGPDIVEFLEGNGHTFAGSARSQIDQMKTSQWNKMQNKWVAGDHTIEPFFGLNPFEIEEKYMKPQAKINTNSHKIEPGRNTTGTLGVGGAKGGQGLIKPAYAFDGFNGTGWDTINLLRIAEDGKLDDDYLVKMQNLRSKTFGDEFEQVRTNLTKGTALGSYGTSPPAVSKSAPVTTTTTTTPSEEDEEEEEEEEEEVVVKIPYSFESTLEPPTFIDIIGESSMTVPTVEEGERKVSSKAYAELDNTKTIPVTSGLIEVEMKTLSKTQGIVIDDVGIVFDPTTEEFDDFEKLMASGMATGKVIEIIDDEGDEQRLLPAPTVKFIVNVDEGKVYIVINEQMLVAAKGEEPYEFSDCEIQIHDPADKNDEGVSQIFLDGNPIEYGKWEKKDGYFNAHYDYGFPMNGVQGLPPECYREHYPDEEPEEVMEQSNTLMTTARGEYIKEGNRQIIFGKPKNYTFDISQLDEKYLQPLALNFDKTLNDDDAVVFVLNYGGKLNNKTNLFPGAADVAAAGFTELQMFSFPNDIRNVRPINSERVVMLQNYHRRSSGEGIKDIMIDSSNLKDEVTYSIDGVDYNAEIYTQVKITFDKHKLGKTEIDETSILIPDGDMRFGGMDNSNSELTGEVVSLNDEDDIANVIVIKGKAQEIYEALEQQRHSARISSKYNAMTSTSPKEVITKTLLVEQTITTSDDKKESMYYLIVGTGKTTKVVKMDMGVGNNE